VRGGVRHAAVLTLIGVVLLAGCGGGAEDEPESQPTEPATSASPSESPTEPDPTPTEVPMPDGPLAAAIADLSRDTGVDPDDIRVVAHEQVTWRDGSLGCPKPGMFYTQALVEGYRIVLRAGGEEVAYHGSAGKPPFRCDHPAPNGAIGA
jgi:hypothetical protein